MDRMLFQPARLGSLTVPNRFVRSATYEAMATPRGDITDELVKLYERLGRGQLGAIISGFAFVEPGGRNAARTVGIHNDESVAGWRKVVAAARAEGSAFFVQLAHAGAQTSRLTLRARPQAPSLIRRDPLYLEKPRVLTDEAIEALIQQFGRAARRAREAGADGVQIHAAHGYLIAEFLSPFFNRRTDAWGGSPENRFRFLREIILAVRQHAGDDFPVLVKIVHDDGTPETGMTPELAADVAGRLAGLGIAGLELSAGGTSWAPFRMSRGEVPLEELTRVFPWVVRPMMRRRLGAMSAAAAFEPDYNAAAARVVRRALGEVPLILVGGIRELASMEALVSSGAADLISLCRPLVREPRLVAHLAAGKATAARCTSCNRCFAAVAQRLPLRCYVDGLPTRR